MSYFFIEVARVEHLEHVAYYEAQHPGLGTRYLSAFEAAMVKVCEKLVIPSDRLWGPQNSDVELNR